VATAKKVCELSVGTTLVKWVGDGTHLVVISGSKGVLSGNERSGQLVVWNLSAGTPSQPVPFAPEAGVLALADRNVAYHQSGRLALATQAGVEIWDAGRKLCTLERARAPLAWSPDGRLAALAADPAVAVVVFKVDGNRALRTNEIPGRAVNLLWTQDGSRIVIGRPGRGPAVCDPETGETLLNLRGPVGRLEWARESQTLLGFESPSSTAPSSIWPASAPPHRP
jgi:hypothetical protein